MGTSSAYPGPKGGTPLVPSWLGPDGADTPAEPSGGSAPTDDLPPNLTPSPPVLTNPPLLAQDAARFTAARNNFSRFAGSGGSDRASLGRAVSQYVSTSSGGSGRASRRMGAARSAGARLLYRCKRRRGFPPLFQKIPYLSLCSLGLTRTLGLHSGGTTTSLSQSKPMCLILILATHLATYRYSAPCKPLTNASLSLSLAHLSVDRKSGPSR